MKRIKSALKIGAKRSPNVENCISEQLFQSFKASSEALKIGIYLSKYCKLYLEAILAFLRGPENWNVPLQMWLTNFEVTLLHAFPDPMHLVVYAVT